MRDFRGFQLRYSRTEKKALEFIAYGTLTPSQVSKWNNVCETYRVLQKRNGVNEALDEIKEKNRTVKRRTGSHRQQAGITSEYDYHGIWIRFHYRGGVADIRLLEFRERGDD